MESNYKGIPLSLWKSGRLLDRLSWEELIELHGIMTCELYDYIEPAVRKSLMIEADLLIDRIKRK